MLNGKGHITIAILVLLLGAATMMLFLFRSEKNLKPTSVDQWLLRAQSAVKENSSRELAKRGPSSGTYTKKGQSREGTDPAIEKSRTGIEKQTKKSSDRASFASTAVRSETKAPKTSRKLKVEEKDLQAQEDVGSREETILPKQDNRRQKEFPEEKMAASLPGNKKTETTKGSGKPEVVEKGSPIDVFEDSSPNDRELKEEVETKKGNSSEESSLEKDTFTIVSKKDIEEIQRKTWAALEFLKD